MTKISVDKYPAKKAKNGYLWRVRFRYKDIYGKIHPYSKGSFATKKEAQMHGVEKLKELEGTGLKEVQEVTLEVLWKRYIESGMDDLSIGTRSEYFHTYDKYLHPVFGQTPIQNLTYIPLQSFFDGKKDLSNSTLRKMKNVLSCCFKIALKMGAVTSNPLRDVELHGKKSVKKDEYISPSEFKALEDDVRCAKRLSEFQIENRLMVLRLGYYMGLRLGEILGLKFEDIDWEERTISVRRQVVVRDGKNILTDRLKTPSSYATLPVCDELYDYLTKWREENPFDFVITANDGNYPARRTIENFFRNHLKKGFHVHQLRHSFATNLYLAGVDQVTAASLTRHSSVEVLNNIYTHPQETKQREAVQRAFRKN